MRNCQGAHYGSTVASDCLQKLAKKLIGRSVLCRELLRSRVQSDRLLLQKVAVWGWLSKATLLFEKHPDAQNRRTLGGGALRPPFVMLVRSSSARAPSHEPEQPKSDGVGRYTTARGCRSRDGLVGLECWRTMLVQSSITAITSQNCWARRPASARPLASYEPPVRPLPVRGRGCIVTFLPVPRCPDPDGCRRCNRQYCGACKGIVVLAGIEGMRNMTICECEYLAGERSVTCSRSCWSPATYVRGCQSMLAL